ncbi:hypothetical protein HK098_008332 [Nowakowskiella sp. JEL0407]|nr:hypothetical protein HK098_008332 [Nowakowskiella sp. JEL0407]
MPKPKSNSSVKAKLQKEFTPPSYCYLDNVIFLFFNNSADLKSALGRPHVFYEGGSLQGPLRGVNFPRLSFMEWVKSLGTDSNTIGTIDENSFTLAEISIITFINSIADALYIVGCLKSDRTTLFHEWTHSQFFLNSNYKSTVLELWDSLNTLPKSEHESLFITFTDQERLKFAQVVNLELKMRGYKVENYTDEFQAYLVAEGEYEFGKKWGGKLKGIVEFLRTSIGSFPIISDLRSIQDNVALSVEI